MRRNLVLFLTTAVLLNVTYIPVMAEEVKIPVKVEEIKKIELQKEKSPVATDGLEKAVKLVKSKLDIPASYTEFSSDMSSLGDKAVWRLRWASKSDYTGNNGGSMEIGVDDKGNIVSYNHYRYSRDYEYRRKLPKISKSRAVDAVKKFIYYIHPDIVEQIVFATDSNNVNIEYDGSYRFNFYRQYNDIPFYDNSISVGVNGETGEIMNFYMNWTDNAVFPDTEKVMRIEAAETAFQDTVGLTLKYRKAYDEDKEKTYLEYSPVVIASSVGMDAFTGEKVVINNGYNPYFTASYKYDISGMTSKEIALSEKEMDEVKKMKEFISLESAEEMLRGMEELEIGQEYRLNYYRLYQVGDNKNYVLRMEFAKPLSAADFGEEIPEEKLKVMIASGEMGQMVNVTMDAKTGEILMLDSYGKYVETGKEADSGKIDTQKVVENFLQKQKPEKFSQMELVEEGDAVDKYRGTRYGSIESYVYTRKVNGIPYEDNQIMINIDPVTGKIKYYSENWDEIEFVSAEDVISKEKAYETLFNKNELKLMYVTYLPDEKTRAEFMAGISTPSIKLVYALNPAKPASIDAYSGVLLNGYNGEPYREESIIRYKDIENHYAKEPIEALLEIGMLPAREYYGPEDAITQKELLVLIGKVRGSYPIEMIEEDIKQKELDGMYAMMINEGILEEGERNPDGSVSREDAVKYLLRSMGYKKFAEMEDLFQYPFEDGDAVDPKAIGYVAIAKSLKIIDASSVNFMPKKEITRAEITVMIYNYMKR